MSPCITMDLLLGLFASSYKYFYSHHRRLHYHPQLFNHQHQPCPSFGWSFSFEMKVKLNESLFTTGHDGGEIEMMYSESLSSDITHWSSLPVQF